VSSLERRLGRLEERAGETDEDFDARARREVFERMSTPELRHVREVFERATRAGNVLDDEGAALARHLMGRIEEARDEE
jgi:hypothetical protein